jgi:hypothetical protein
MAKKSKGRGRKSPSGQGDLFDGPASRKARDKGMKRVLEGEDQFRIDIAKFIDNLPHGWQGTGEDIRRMWTGKKPHHPNCWGAVCHAALKRATLVKLPFVMRRPLAVKSHARPTHVFRRV